MGCCSRPRVCLHNRAGSPAAPAAAAAASLHARTGHGLWCARPKGAHATQLGPTSGGNKPCCEPPRTVPPALQAKEAHAEQLEAQLTQSQQLIAELGSGRASVQEVQAVIKVRGGRHPCRPHPTLLGVQLGRWAPTCIFIL